MVINYIMIRKTNLILITILVILLGYYYFSEVASDLNTVVNITDQGFSDEKIVVEKGTTVTWINQGGHLHWPASNPHPNHNLYPSFGGCINSKLDACHGLQTGESFSFKFYNLGQWGIHDHLFPGFVMVVEVVDRLTIKDKNIFDKSILISGKEFRGLQYGDQMEIIKYITERDPAKAWDYLKSVFIIDGQVVNSAHEFAHIVGNYAYEKFGLDGIKICDWNFGFGCFHGVTEKMLLSEGLSNLKFIEEKCIDIFPPDKSQDYASCIHGTGHGVFDFVGGDIKKALLNCDTISETNRKHCYDGVFMENSSGGLGTFSKDDPWKLCNALDERYQIICAKYQSQIFFINFGLSDLVTVGESCALGESPELQEECFKGVGNHIADSYMGKSKQIIEGCNKMPSLEGREICINGGAVGTAFQRYLGFDNYINELCNSLTKPRRLSCLDQAGKIIRHEK